MRAVEGASRLAGGGLADFVFVLWEENFCLSMLLKSETDQRQPEHQLVNFNALKSHSTRREKLSPKSINAEASTLVEAWSQTTITNS